MYSFVCPFTRAAKGAIIRARKERFIMATYNPRLEDLTLGEIEAVSERFLMGWHDLYGAGYGFRVKGLNRRREEFGLEPLTKDLSLAYRLAYVRANYSQDDIERLISDYLKEGRVGDTRWTGIELFGCRFGREYAAAFRALLGSSTYRRISEECRRAKLVSTQMERYGGVGVGGDQAFEKMRQTVQRRYGVDNVMHVDRFKQRLAATNGPIYGGASPFCDPSVQAKGALGRWRSAKAEMERLAASNSHLSGVLASRYECLLYCTLVGRFGEADVFYQYGVHPKDSRYPYNCDFYIKSLDVFIELNIDYSHGHHWFDASNHDDVLRRDHLLASGKTRNAKAVRTWCEVDVEKRERARVSGIRYLVFWDGSCSRVDGESVPNLRDFYMWFNDYNCNYDAFVADFPANTY